MRRNKFGKGYEENDRTTHVKLYKAGKKWVQSLMSKIGLISFSAKDVEVNLVEKDEEHQKKGRTLIDATLITGAMLGGVSVLGNQNAMADTKSVDTTTTDALAATNEATLTSASTSTTTSTSEDSLASLSTSESLSNSLSQSVANSQSVSTSVSTSQSIASNSTSSSTSTKLSTSTSNSGSGSVSTSTNSTSASQLSSTSTASLVSSLSLSESQHSASDSATQSTATDAAATNVISANQLTKLANSYMTLFSRFGVASSSDDVIYTLSGADLNVTSNGNVSAASTASKNFKQLITSISAKYDATTGTINWTVTYDPSLALKTNGGWLNEKFFHTVYNSFYIALEDGSTPTNVQINGTSATALSYDDASGYAGGNSPTRFSSGTQYGNEYYTNVGTTLNDVSTLTFTTSYTGDIDSLSNYGISIIGATSQHQTGGTSYTYETAADTYSGRYGDTTKYYAIIKSNAFLVSGYTADGIDTDTINSVSTSTSASESASASTSASESASASTSASESASASTSASESASASTSASESASASTSA
ncbi:KxYKxGKxW signal peptide domain-containing protein, partial [Limosilactobacillus fermentum]|uniref:KxYKxGKxW signal peptide domain-containing protein n=2 Tax=Limosilactobacillus fermentum TaxID=1613 RepID=UPI002551382F